MSVSYFSSRASNTIEARENAVTIPQQMVRNPFLSEIEMPVKIPNPTMMSASKNKPSILSNPLHFK
jgi:predicted amino acid racemase